MTVVVVVVLGINVPTLCCATHALRFSKRAKRTLDMLEQAMEARDGLVHYPV